MRPAVALAGTVLASFLLASPASADQPKPAPFHTWQPPFPRLGEPFAKTFEMMKDVGNSTVSTACGCGVAPWAYRGRTHGSKNALRHYVFERKDRVWTQAFLRLLMRESDWDSIGACVNSRKPCDRVPEVPFVVVEFHKRAPIYALLDFRLECATVFRAGQPFGSIDFADRTDSLLGMIRAALPRDKLLQELVLTNVGEGPDPDREPAHEDSVYVEDLPEVVSRVAPAYPMAARTKDIEGTVSILALIGRDGMVKDAFVVHSIPKLDDAALDAVWQWKFKPAKSRGEPIAMWVGVPVKFILH